MIPPALFINFSPSWGGLEMSSVTLFKLLASRGREVWFAADPRGRIFEDLCSSPFSGRLLPVRNMKYFDPLGWLKVRPLIFSRGVRIIHSFKASDVFFGAALKRLWPGADLRLLLHLQMLPKRSRRDFLHRAAYRQLDLIITLTRQIAERAGELWPIERRIAVPVPWGIDPLPYRSHRGRSAEARRRFGVPEGRIVLGIAGQLCEIKGQILVLEAFLRIRRRFPQAMLLIAGAPARGDREYLPRLQAFVREHALGENVKILGFVEDVPRFMAALDVFVLGSRAEPFGLVVIEAMASGCLTVASRAGGVPEIIDHGRDGLLYESGDPAALAASLESALTMEAERRAAIVRAAQDKVGDRFTLDLCADRIEAAYRELAWGAAAA